MFYNFMHDKGYTFAGDTPITALTQDEIAYLQLGHMIEHDEMQDNMQSKRRGGDMSREHYNASKSRKQFAKKHGT